MSTDSILQSLFSYVVRIDYKINTNYIGMYAGIISVGVT